MIHSELYFSIFFEEEGRGTFFLKKSTQGNSAKNVVTAQGFCLVVALK